MYWVQKYVCCLDNLGPFLPIYDRLHVKSHTLYSQSTPCPFVLMDEAKGIVLRLGFNSTRDKLSSPTDMMHHVGLQFEYLTNCHDIL